MGNRNNVPHTHLQPHRHPHPHPRLHPPLHLHLHPLYPSTCTMVAVFVDVAQHDRNPIMMLGESYGYVAHRAIHAYHIVLLLLLRCWCYVDVDVDVHVFYCCRSLYIWSRSTPNCMCSTSWHVNLSQSLGNNMPRIRMDVHVYVPSWDDAVMSCILSCT